MRISDWSSDVCSSDLLGDAEGVEALAQPAVVGVEQAELLAVRHDLGEQQLLEGILVLQLRIVLLEDGDGLLRSEEHTSELQSLMRISYAVFCLKKKIQAVHTVSRRIPVRCT